ncbi:MAG: thiamine-binding protein [Chitinophagaceae bacterium]
MHHYRINASIQLVPINDAQKHPYVWIDEIIVIIQQSGLLIEVSAFQSIVEGTYEEITQLIDDINEYLYVNNCVEWLLQVQYQLRSNTDMTALEKTKAYQ